MNERELNAAGELYDLLLDYYDDSGLQPPIKIGSPLHKAICDYRNRLPNRHLPPGEGELMRQLIALSRSDDLTERSDAQANAEKWAKLLENKYPSLCADDPDNPEACDVPDGDEPHADVAGAGKSVAPRNAKFLEWYEARGTDTFHKPAVIHRKWNGMKQEQRAAICPESPNKITKATVVKGIKRARDRRKQNVSSHRER